MMSNMNQENNATLKGKVYFFFVETNSKYLASREYDQDDLVKLPVPFNYTDLKNHFVDAELNKIEFDEKIDFHNSLDYLEDQVKRLVPVNENGKVIQRGGYYELDFDQKTVSKVGSYFFGTAV